MVCLPRGLVEKKRVERHHAGHFRDGNTHLAGDVGLQLQRQAAVDLLRQVKNLNQAPFLPAVQVDDVGNLGKLVVAAARAALF